MGRKVLVTGATGFIGYSLLSELRQNYFPQLIPIGAYRSPEQRLRLQRLLDYPSTSPSVVHVDLRDDATIDSCVKDVSILIHLAAQMDFFPRDVETLMRINVDGTRKLLEACVRESQRTGQAIRFVYVSSTEAIGPTTSGKADEDAPRAPDSDYGVSKVRAENVVKEYRSRLETVILRPTGVYGPGERFFFFELMQMVASGLSIIAPSPMTGKLMFTHVEDVVGGLITCATHSEAKGNIYNICPDESTTTMQIIETLSDVLKCPRPALVLSEPIGVFLMRMVAPVLNLGKQRRFLYHPKTVKQSMTDREYSNERLKRLGFSPKYSIRVGAEHTLRHEMRAGAITRGLVPGAIKHFIHFLSVITFSLNRLVRRRQNEVV